MFLKYSNALKVNTAEHFERQATAFKINDERLCRAVKSSVFVRIFV